MRISDHIIQIVLITAILPFGRIFAQQELVPLWEHTWPFGQEGTITSSNPGSLDNHVAVDPISGKIICTINDGLNTYSEMADLLYVFTPDGTDITTVPGPVGYWRGGSPYINHNRTTDITMCDDRVFAHQYVVTYPVSVVGNLVFGGHLDSTKWIFAHRNLAAWTTGQKLITTDGSYVVYSGHNWLYCTTAEGWYVWHKYSYPADLLIHDGILYAPVMQEIQRIQISDGTQLAAIQTPGIEYEYLAFHQGSLYAAAQSSSINPIEVTKMDPEGIVDWTTIIPNTEGHILYGFTIDASGRAWVLKSNSSLWTTAAGADSHLWVVNDAELFGPYTFHERINSISSDDAHIYLTGGIDTTSTHTYLAAIQTDLITGVQGTRAPEPELSIGPNPASDQIQVIGKLLQNEAALLDSQGRSISFYPLQNSRSIPVDHLQNGVYYLKVGSRTLRFVVMH